MSLPRRALLLPVALVLVSVPMVGVASAKSPTCFGKKPTITLSKSNKSIKGTKKNDVILITGKNDSVDGQGGKDLICGKDVKKITLGKGGPNKVQVQSGTVNGGSANDTIVQKGTTTKPSTFSGGLGVNSYTVPAAQLRYVTIKPGVGGDVLNGQALKLGLPTAGPEVSLYTYDQVLGEVAAPTVANVAFNTFSGQFSQAEADDDEYFGYNTVEFQVADLAAPAGSAIASWSFDPGDGSVLRTGPGSPPEQLRIPYLAAKAYTASLTVVDTLGRTATSHMSVSVSQEAAVNVGIPTVPASGPVTIPVTVTPGVNTTGTQWWVDYGDGTPVENHQGTGTVTLSHTYALGSYYLDIYVSDSSGFIQGTSQSIYQNNGTAGLVVEGYVQTGNPAAPLVVSSSAVSADVGRQVYVKVSDPFDDSAGDTDFDLSWGDGTSTELGNSSISHSHSYRIPGQHTVTVTAHNLATTVVKTLTVTTTPKPIVIGVSLPTTVNQGPTAVGITSTPLPAGTRWLIDFSDGYDPVFGTGPLPASVTHTFNPQNYEGGGSQYAEVTIHTPEGYETYGSVYTTVLGPFPGVSDVGFGQGYSSAYLGWSPIRAGRPGYASADLVPGNGAKVSSATVTFGDGTPVLSPAGVQSGYLDSQLTGHAYATPGDYTLAVSTTDTKKHTVSQTTTVSVAGSPTLTTAADSYAVAVGAPVTIASIAGAAGANDKLIGWSVQWQDMAGAGDTNALGALPTSLTHTYATAGTYYVAVGLGTTHGLAKVKRVIIKVT